MEISENSYTQEAITRLRQELYYVLSIPTQTFMLQQNLLKYFVAYFFTTSTNTIPDEISTNLLNHDKYILCFRNWESERKNSPKKIKVN